LSAEARKRISATWIGGFAFRSIAGTILFIAATILANRAGRLAASAIGAPCPLWWPLHVFHTRLPTPAEAVLALTLAAALPFGMRCASAVCAARRPAVLIVLGVLLIVGTNAIQGYEAGFVRPIAGGRLQYYHDAVSHAADPARFLREFGRIQPTLGDHARTHPPGAVLLIEFLRRATGDRPAAISLLIAICSAVVTAVAFRRLVQRLIPHADSSFAALLLLLLPAIQIYYCASLDAVIAALLLAAITCTVPAPGEAAPAKGALLLAAFCLTAAAALTFLWVWALPVIGAIWATRAGWRDAIVHVSALTLAVAVAFAVVWAVTGFDYLSAGVAAAHLENPLALAPAAHATEYALSRIEDVAEILVFLGPLLIGAIVRGWSPLRRASAPAAAAVTTAIITVAVMFVAGAFRTGETARGCLFLWPFLLLPVLAGEQAAMAETESGVRRDILYAVFAQAVLMQAFGSFFW
jgi:hypothetical protein